MSHRRRQAASFFMRSALVVRFFFPSFMWIAIIGNACSGKSTLARKLAGEGAPSLNLDRMPKEALR